MGLDESQWQIASKAHISDGCVCFRLAVMESAAPEFDVYEAMDWKDGVGTLPGSELKVSRCTILPEVLILLMKGLATLVIS